MIAYESLSINIEVQADSAKDLSSKFNSICFVGYTTLFLTVQSDLSLDNDVSELMDVMKSDIQPIVPKTNYIALGKESSCVYVCSPLVQKMMKKSAEFQEAYDHYKVLVFPFCEEQMEGEARQNSVKESIEEEKARLDADYRKRAQELKRRCQMQLDDLELENRAYSVYKKQFILQKTYRLSRLRYPWSVATRTFSDNPAQMKLAQQNLAITPVKRHHVRS